MDVRAVSLLGEKVKRDCERDVRSSSDARATSGSRHRRSHLTLTVTGSHLLVLRSSPTGFRGEERLVAVNIACNCLEKTLLPPIWFLLFKTFVNMHKKFVTGSRKLSSDIMVLLGGGGKLKFSVLRLAFES